MVMAGQSQYMFLGIIYYFSEGALSQHFHGTKTSWNGFILVMPCLKCGWMLGPALCN